MPCEGRTFSRVSVPGKSVLKIDKELDMKSYRKILQVANHYRPMSNMILEFFRISLSLYAMLTIPEVSLHIVPCALL